MNLQLTLRFEMASSGYIIIVNRAHCRTAQKTMFS